LFLLALPDLGKPLELFSEFESVKPCVESLPLALCLHLHQDINKLNQGSGVLGAQGLLLSKAVNGLLLVHIERLHQGPAHAIDVALLYAGKTVFSLVFRLAQFVKFAQDVRDAGALVHQIVSVSLEDLDDLEKSQLDVSSLLVQVILVLSREELLFLRLFFFGRGLSFGLLGLGDIFCWSNRFLRGHFHAFVSVGVTARVTWLTEF
jgi:hypothetical protein